jgi:formiminotetrahydrofolate cyclodeaminase
MINLPGIEDKSVADRLRHEAEEILEAAEESAKQARQIVVEKIG